MLLYGPRGIRKTLHIYYIILDKIVNKFVTEKSDKKFMLNHVKSKLNWFKHPLKSDSSIVKQILLV